jgi:hypothetical protein
MYSMAFFGLHLRNQLHKQPLEELAKKLISQTNNSTTNNLVALQS